MGSSYTYNGRPPGSKGMLRLEGDLKPMWLRGMYVTKSSAWRVKNLWGGVWRQGTWWTFRLQ